MNKYECIICENIYESVFYTKCPECGNKGLLIEGKVSKYDSFFNIEMEGFWKDDNNIKIY